MSETAAFHLGKIVNKKKLRRHHDIPAHIRKSGKKPEGTRVAPTIKSRFLIPTKYSEKFMKPFLQAVRNSYEDDSYKNCVAYIEKIKSNVTYPMTLVVPYSGAYSTFTRDRLSLQIIQRCLAQNERFRWQMKKLVYRWRIHKCRAMNEEDIFTGETPQKLIQIYDWQQRCKYAFEASTVFRDYLTKIQNAIGLFVVPKVPRNPFTNAELTYGQLHFLIRGLVQHGFNHWSFDALKECGYSMDVFQEVYAYPLKHENLKNVFRRPTEATCVDVVYDFIEDEYYHHSIAQPYKFGWDLALRERPDLDIIQAWRRLALEQQQLVIRYDGATLEQRMKPIHDRSLILIARPVTDIRRIYTKWANSLPKDTEEEEETLNHNINAIENIVFPNYVITFIESRMDVEVNDGSDSP